MEISATSLRLSEALCMEKKFLIHHYCVDSLFMWPRGVLIFNSGMSHLICNKRALTDDDCNIFVDQEFIIIWHFCSVPLDTVPDGWNDSCLSEAVSSIVCLSKQKSFDSISPDPHLCRWALAACCWALLADCRSPQQNKAALPPFVLFPNFFPGISSCQLPSPTHPLHCTAPHNPPSVWGPCQAPWHMKTIVLVCLRRHNLLLRQSFSPTDAQLTAGQTDFFLLLVHLE